MSSYGSGYHSLLHAPTDTPTSHNLGLVCYLPTWDRYEAAKYSNNCTDPSVTRSHALCGGKQM